MVHAVTQSSEVEVPSCSKDKGKHALDGVLL